MKILSLSSIPLLPYLGSGKTRLHWTNGLRNLGHDVDVLQPVDFEFWMSMRRIKKLRMALGIFLKVRKTLQIKSYDIIEFYGDEYWILLLWLKKIKRNAPVLVAHVDGLELNDSEKGDRFWNTDSFFKKWLFKITYNRLSKITFKLAEKYVCGCVEDLDYVIKKRLFLVSDAACISPGIDDEFHHLPFIKEKNKNIVFFGSWIARKGIKIIPQVISAILRKYPNVCFEIFGAWNNKEEIFKQFSDEFHAQVNVYDKLKQEDLIQILCSSSIFFFPTYSEGLGLATLEAMSCSIAVVTTPTGIGTSLENDKHAIICDFNDVENMITGICRLIDDEESKSKIALNGYNFAKGFIWKKQISKLEQQYSQWLSNLAF